MSIFSADEAIFYRPVLDRLEMFFLQMGRYILRPVGIDRCSYVLSYFTDGMDCHVAVLRTGRHFRPVVVIEDVYRVI